MVDDKIPKNPHTFDIVAHKAINDPELRRQVIESNRRVPAYVLILVGAVLLFIGILY